jgi:hypothetical protein
MPSAPLKLNNVDQAGAGVGDSDGHVSPRADGPYRLCHGGGVLARQTATFWSWLSRQMVVLCILTEETLRYLQT